MRLLRFYDSSGAFYAIPQVAIEHVQLLQNGAQVELSTSRRSFLIDLAKGPDAAEELRRFLDWAEAEKIDESVPFLDLVWPPAED